MKSKLAPLFEIFNSNGQFKLEGYDPYTVDEKFSEFHAKIFDEDGEVIPLVENLLGDFIQANQCHWQSDAVKTYYAIMSSYVKGNGNALMMWRN